MFIDFGPLFIGTDAEDDGEVPTVYQTMPEKFKPLQGETDVSRSQAHAAFPYANNTESRERVGFGTTTITATASFLLDERDGEYSDFTDFFENDATGVGSDTEFLFPHLPDSTPNRLWYKNTFSPRPVGDNHWKVTLTMVSHHSLAALV